MTAPRCHCPEVPETTGPVFDAVACRCCGAPLELTCAGRCGTEHMRASMDDARAQLRSPAAGETHDPGKRPYTKSAKPRTYAEKACALCHQPFQPTGPRSLVCERCKSLKPPVSIAADPGASGAE
jgi:hypothetical protein